MGKLDDVFKKINKTYGSGSVGNLNDMPMQDIDVISSGSLTLNDALGVGGWARGRITEIYGPESSGKTTLCIHAIAECQKTGGKAAFIDMEHAFDKEYAENLGVDTDSLIFAQPDYGEQALEMIDMLVETGEVDILVVDSVAAMIPKRELEGEMGDANVGVLAKMMSQAMRKLVGKVKKTNTAMIFINQLREKIGVMFGSPEVTTGGRALKFAASVRVDIRRTGSIKKGEEVVANTVKVKITKNKIAPPFKIAMLEIAFGIGVDAVGEIVNICVDADIIDKNGSWYSYGDTKLGQGLPAVKELIRDNEELLQELKDLATLAFEEK